MINMDLKTNSIVVFVTLVIVGVVLYYYWFVPVKVELIEVAQIRTEEKLPGTWWSTAFRSIEKDYNIKLPEVDLNRYSLLLSGGREIKEFEYQRISKFQVPYKDRPYIGTAVFKEELHSNTIFVYKFRTLPIIYDDINWPEVKIEN